MADGDGYVRPSWDDVWFTVAGIISLRSRCSRDRVGAVIVDAQNRIVATGYNGPPAGWPIDNAPCIEFCQRAINGPSEEGRLTYSDCVSLHAEANALMVCDRSDRVGGTIYASSDICQTCAKLIANSGLSRVVIPRKNEVHAHRDSLMAYTYLELCGLAVARIDDLP